MLTRGEFLKRSGIILTALTMPKYLSAEETNYEKIKEILKKKTRFYQSKYGDNTLQIYLSERDNETYVITERKLKKGPFFQTDSYILTFTNPIQEGKLEKINKIDFLFKKAEKNESNKKTIIIKEERKNPFDKKTQSEIKTLQELILNHLLREDIPPQKEMLEKLDEFCAKYFLDGQNPFKKTYTCEYGIYKSQEENKSPETHRVKLK